MQYSIYANVYVYVYMIYRPIPGRLSVTLPVGTPLCPFDVAYSRAYGLSTSGLFKKFLCTPLCGHEK